MAARRAETFATDEEQEPTTANGAVEEELVDDLLVEGAAEADVEAVGAEEEADEEAETPVADLLPSPTEPDELERQLTQDEEMERQNRHQHHEAPHFRKESD